jgi:hypothetical protein
MERSRVTRYVRIAVTALSLTACVLLIALWVRSYTWSDAIGGSVSETENETLRLHSTSGKLSLNWFLDAKLRDWAWTTRSSQELEREQEEVARFFARIGRILTPASGFAFRWSDNSLSVKAPHWFLVTLFGISAALCGIPWFKWRFSLRTLLLATTLVAVGLGTIIYLAR